VVEEGVGVLLRRGGGFGNEGIVDADCCSQSSGGIRVMDEVVKAAIAVC
jgi:hypothetical protein